MTSGAVVARSLVTTRGSAPRRGLDMADLLVVPDAGIAWDERGILTYVGPSHGLSDPTNAREVRGALVPGFVDAHTHVPFFGWRADEFEARVGGQSYRDLHGLGGGIARSARLLAAASDEDVLSFGLSLAAEMAAHGTTATELKTGYGLSLEAELRQARLARRLSEAMPQTATVTLLACHAVPEGKTRRDWVDQVCAELIPTAVEEGLVDAVDIYVEDIAFSVEDFERVADVARRHDLFVRCHADQLGASAAAEAAVGAGARNADHLNHLSAEGVAALGAGDTVAGLLPVADLFTREPAPPVAELRDAGAALMMATDFNPGTCPCLSMPEVMAWGASLYGLQPSASLTAMTLNPAWVLGLHDQLGSLEVGKRADFLVLDTNDLAMIPYRPGHNPVAETWVNGRQVASGSDPGVSA